MWPGMQIWNRDIDCSGSQALINDVAYGTGTSLNAAYRSHLTSLNGVLFEASTALTNPQWVLRLGVWHRSRKAFGQQFCPICLANDPIPFYRITWRLAWATTCLDHGCRLNDCCEKCGHPVIPYRYEEPVCSHCKFDLRDTRFIHANPLALRLQSHLQNAMNGGIFQPFGLNAMHSLSVFGTVRQVAKTLATGARSAELRKTVKANLLFGTEVGFEGDTEPPKSTDIEKMRVGIRHEIMALTSRCLEGWPFMFVAYCSESRNWWSWVTKDCDPKYLPYIYYDEVRRYLVYD
jgi:hypothetical protein